MTYSHEVHSLTENFKNVGHACGESLRETGTCARDSIGPRGGPLLLAPDDFKGHWKLRLVLTEPITTGRSCLLSFYPSLQYCYVNREYFFNYKSSRGLLVDFFFCFSFLSFQENFQLIFLSNCSRA